MPRKTACPPVRRPWRTVAWVALCSVLLGACATTQAPPDSGLSGQWRLDAAASDNIAMVVSGAVSKAQARLRRRNARFFGRSGGAGPGVAGGNAGGGGDADNGGGEDDTATDVFGDNPRIGPDFRELRSRLMDALGASASLALGVRPGTVEVQRDQLPPRDYQPGERTTRYDEYGTAILSSAWDGKAFELRQRYTSGARLTERYEVGTGGTLLYTRTLQDPTVGKVQVKSVYHRAGAG
jgi:hypothetical protein